MRSLLVMLVGVLLAVPATAQELPRETPEGQKALDLLLDRLHEGGQLRSVKSAKSVKVQLLVADAAGLRKALAARRDELTPALRAALIARANVADDYQSAALLELLALVADVVDDELTRAHALALAGGSDYNKGNYQAALPKIREAARRFAAAKEPLWQANQLNRLGLIHRELGRYAEALDLYHEALKLFLQGHGEKHGNVAACRGNIASVYQSQGKYVAARNTLRAVLRLEEELYGEDSHETAITRVNLGLSHYKLGELTEALKQMQKAVALLRDAPGGRNLDLALALDKLAIVFDALDDTPKALKRNAEALQIVEGFYAEPHPDLANILHNRSAFLRKQGKLKEARECLDKSLALNRKMYGKENPHVAADLNDLAMMARDAAEEISLLEEAARINRKHFGDFNHHLALNLYNLGAVYALNGQRPKALGYFRQAVDALLLDPAKAGQGPDKQAVGDFVPTSQAIHALNACGLLHRLTAGKPANAAGLRAASEYFALAAELIDHLRYHHLEHETSKLLLTGHDDVLFEHMKSRFDLHALQGKQEDLHAAFVAMEQGLARVFLEKLVASRAQVVAGVAPELRKRHEDLLAALGETETQLLREKSRPLEQQDTQRLKKLAAALEGLRGDVDSLLRQMEKDNPAYAALQRPRPCNLGDARAALSKDEVALVFIPVEERTYLVLVEARPQPGDKSNGIAIYDLPGWDDLVELIAPLTTRETLGRPANVKALARQAFAALLGPCQQRLKGKALVIVPGGPLCFLPFGLLVCPDGKYLVEKHRIRYAPSLTTLHHIRLWKNAPKRPQPEVPLFAVGDPDYGDSTAKKLATDPARRELLWREGKAVQFPRLVHSGKEVDAIADLLKAKPEFVLTGAKATEANVKAASAKGLMGKARYVHFATHGILGLDQGKQPALVLSLVGNTEEDGFLQMDEITSLKLNADLVVLSACRTGQGRMHRGEGVTGLARAFLYAGSKGVVCSLWNVADKETADLMVDFYSRLQKGASAPEALRKAQLSLLNAGKAPVYWAPFILIGE
jgi:CHAT domain-containing protein/tetratricopeptide (TPR) repeat protein